MKEVLIEKLTKMEDLEQRKLLKDILAGFFSNLIDHQETMNTNLEKKIFAEISDQEGFYDIFTTVSPKNNIDPLDDFLFPVCPAELAEKAWELDAIQQQLAESQAFWLESIFLECDYLQIKSLLTTAPTFQGEIITNTSSYSIQVKLQPNQPYQQKITALYQLFQKNNIPWKTLNIPYATHFFEVIIIKIAEGFEFSKEEKILEINYHLREWEAYKKKEHLLLWNIEELSLNSNGFPMPALDKINYEHVITLDKIGNEHGYLIDGDPTLIKYLKRTATELIVVQPVETESVWPGLKITQRAGWQQRKYAYQLISNKRQESFINRFTQNYASRVRTKGEIYRIINSFEISRYFELVEVLFPTDQTSAVNTYDTNSFMEDHIRLANDQKRLCLRFQVTYPEKFIIYDLLSFLISEVQMYFPEYRLEGALV